VRNAAAAVGIDARSIAPIGLSMHQNAKNGWHFDPNNLSMRDVLIIAPIVLVVSAAFIAFAFLVSGDTYIRWGGLGVNTAIIFAFFIYHSRKFLRARKFWFLTASLLTAHLVIWILLLSHIGEWKLAWFLIMVLEVPAFLYLRDWPGVIAS
jgi:hypothetical protein